MKIDSWKTKTGLRVVHVPYPSMDTVTVLALTKTGSKNESEKLAGISHFIEHMFFKGTEKRPTSQEVAESLDEVGGEFNAFTGKEYTGYYAKVAKVHADLAVDVISDLLQHSLFETTEINREKGVIVEEMRMYQDSPIQYVPELLEGLLYPDQAVGRMIIGTEKTVRGIKREDFLKYLGQQYVTENMTVVIVGSITKAKATKLVEEGFKDLPSGKPKLAMQKAVDEQSEPGLLLHYKETDQAHIALGFRGVPQRHKDSPAYQLLSIVLGGGMSSRLFAVIREKMGLAYYIRAGMEAMTDTGVLEIRAGVDVTRLVDAVAAIIGECERLAQDGIPEKELKKAKEYIRGKTQLSLEKSDEIAFFVGEQEILHQDIETLETKFEKVDRVTEADIVQVAKKIFTNENMNLAVIGPYRDPAPVMDVLTF